MHFVSIFFLQNLVIIVLVIEKNRNYSQCTLKVRLPILFARIVNKRLHNKAVCVEIINDEMLPRVPVI